NKDDVVTADADNLIMAFSGAFTGPPAEGLHETVLIQTSKRSGTVESFMASLGGSQVANSLTQTSIQYPLAIRLNGEFKTAFPEGKPQASPSPSASPEQKPEEKASLKESAQPSSVVLMGDADMIQD